MFEKPLWSRAFTTSIVLYNKFIGWIKRNKQTQTMKRINERNEIYNKKSIQKDFK